MSTYQRSGGEGNGAAPAAASRVALPAATAAAAPVQAAAVAAPERPRDADVDWQGRERPVDLERLRVAAMELFGAAVDEDRLRGWMRGALDGQGDATLRVTLFSRELTVREPAGIGAPDVLVAVLPPGGAPPAPLRLTTTSYAREHPHLKHAATFGLIAARRAARMAGFDDALFAAGEVVSEGATWNIVFADATGLVWPEAPMLDGVTQQLIRTAWPDPQSRRPVTVQQAKAMPAFALNAGFGVAEIASIDDVDLPPSAETAAALRATVDSHAPQPI